MGIPEQPSPVSPNHATTALPIAGWRHAIAVSLQGGQSVCVIHVKCEVSRWVSSDPQPGLVEATLVDVDGRSWYFVDKAPIFDAEGSLTEASNYPVPGAIRYVVVRRETFGALEVVTIDTGRPDGVTAGRNGESSETIFRVRADSIEGDRD